MVRHIKKIICLAYGICLALCCLGDTDRVTINGIEWLYTVNHEGRRIVLEKAILLTSEIGVYDMSLSLELGSLFGKNMETGKYYVDEWGGAYEVWIGASAFEGNEYLRSVEIDPCISSEVSLTICEKAFKDCVYLEYIDTCYGGHGERDVPIKIKSIQKSAFENVGTLNGWGRTYFCDKKTFCISTITNVGEKAFYNSCAQLPSRMLSNSLEYVGDYAFASPNVEWCNEDNDKDIWSGYVVVPKNTQFGEYAFQGNRIYGNVLCEASIMPATIFSQCYFGFESLIIPEGVIEICANAFSSVRGAYDGDYVTLVLPKTLKKIGASAFSGGWGTYNCGMKGEGHDKHPYHFYSTLDGELIIPEGVEEMGVGAFSCHPLLDKVAILGSITSRL